MMNSRGLAFRLVLVNTLLLAGGLLAGGWWLERARTPAGRWGGGALIVTLGMAIGLAATRRIVHHPVRRIAEIARDLSRRNLAARAEVTPGGELEDLARTLNELRVRWSQDVQSLDRQRKLLAALLNQLHEGVIVARNNGRIMLMNPAAVRLLALRSDTSHSAGAPPGATTEEAEALLAGEDRHGYIGRLVEECIPHHDLQQLLHAPPESPQPRAELEERRVELDTQAGAVLLLARASNLMLPDSERSGAETPAGRLLVLTDITEIGRALQMRTDFVANASHELRIPLSTIHAAIETLAHLNLAEETEDARHFIQLIDRQCGRLNALVIDLLDLARVEAQSAPFEAQQVVLRHLLDEISEHFAEAVRARELRWESRCADEARDHIEASPQLLRLALDNLVENAIKFTEPGGAVRLLCRAAEDEVEFVVEDEGCGIPEAEQERVFERFYQVERSRGGPRRGTGLGLSIVRHAVNALGGQIELRSSEGRGTRIAFRIPCQPHPRTPADAPHAARAT